MRDILLVGIPILALVLFMLYVRHSDRAMFGKMLEESKKNVADYMAKKRTVEEEAEKAKAELPKEEPFSIDNAKKLITESDIWPPKQ